MKYSWSEILSYVIIGIALVVIESYLFQWSVNTLFETKITLWQGFAGVILTTLLGAAFNATIKKK